MLNRLLNRSLTSRRRPRPKHLRRTHPRFEALEPRMVLSAAPLQIAAGELVGVEDPLLAAGEEETVADSSGPGGQASIVNGTVVPTSAYPAVGRVTSNDGLCTGTLIGPRHVLTAEHCSGTNAFFRLSGTTRAVTQQILHPTDDIAVFVLSSDVTGVTPRNILRSNPINGETLTLVGYGEHGTTNNPIEQYGTLREGHTDLQFIQSDLIGWRFDGDGESSHSFGDSGGPAFVDRDGELVIAGVASFVTGQPNTPGTQGWDVRVDAFEEWIDNIIGQAEPPLPFEADLHQTSPGAGSTVVSVDGANAWEMGAIQTPSDDDSFEFTLDATTDVTLTVAGTDGRLNPDVRLFDSGLTEIGYNNDIGGGNTNSQITQTLDAGTYYFTVSSFVNGSIGWYSVAVDLGANPSGDQHFGNPHPLATDITPNADGEIALRETLETTGDRDVFEFVVDQTSTVQFAATAADSSLDPRLRLFDGGGAEIRDNNDVLSPNETDSYFFETIDPGTYYLMVSSSSSASSGDYVVTIDGAIGPQTAIPGDFNDDGNVDGDDFLIWQSSFNTNDGGDADGDGDTDGDDFLIWQGNFESGGGGGSKGRPVIPSDGGGNDFFPQGKDKGARTRGSMIKPSPWHPKRMGYKRLKVGPSLTARPTTDLPNKLPKIYLSGPSSQDDRSVSQQDPTEVHDRVFAGRSHWLRDTIANKTV